MQAEEGGRFPFLFLQSNSLSERKLLPGCTMHKWKQLSPRKATERFSNAFQAQNQARTSCEHTANYTKAFAHLIFPWPSGFWFLFFNFTCFLLSWLSFAAKCRDEMFVVSAQLLHSPATAAGKNSAARTRYRPFLSAGISLPMPL